jgi:hypothetical protein
LLFIGNSSNTRAKQERNQKTLGLSGYAQEIEYMKIEILLLNKYTANMNSIYKDIPVCVFETINAQLSFLSEKEVQEQLHNA